MDVAIFFNARLIMKMLAAPLNSRHALFARPGAVMAVDSVNSYRMSCPRKQSRTAWDQHVEYDVCWRSKYLHEKIKYY